MEIIRVTMSKDKLVKSKVIAVPKVIGGNEHFEVRCGNYIKGAWCIAIGIVDGLLPNTEVLHKLEGDTYKLLPIRRDGEFITDRRGNRFYFIGVDYDSSTKDDKLIIWDLPNNIDKLQYSFNGELECIGEGSNGEIKKGNLTLSPSFLLYSTGVSRLSCEGISPITGEHIKTELII